MKPITDKKRDGWIDLVFGYRAYQLGCRFFRVQSAVSLHHDTVANNFKAACQRFYRISSLAIEVFIQYPELKPFVLMFADKSPVDLKHDSLLLVLRKILRQVLSFPPIFCLLKQSVAIAERWNLPKFVMAPLYRWTMGVYIFRGYRDGLRLLKSPKA